VLRLRVPPGHDAERRYIADVLLREFLGLDVAVESGVDTVELTDGTDTLELPDVLFAAPRDEWLALAPDVLRERKDIFGAAFFCLSRFEETAIGERDERDRFPRTASLTEGPLVNELVEQLWSALQERWPRLERRLRAFRTLPSHDVDTIRPGPLRWAAGDLLTRRDPLLAARRLAALLRPAHDPVWSFDYLMNESERRSLRSAFYFIANPAGPPGAADYRLDEPRVQRLLRRIHERGHEIGLHPSYETYRDPEQLAREAATLRHALELAGIDQAELGGRQHWLRWTPATWTAWEDAGLAYDSTLGWPDAPGFRAACCYEYPVFDLERRRALRLRERPLILMDVAVAPVVRPSAPSAAGAIDALKAECRRYEGDFTVLWHNEWALSRDQQRLYRRALDA
jgi:hypothetical protein